MRNCDFWIVFLHCIFFGTVQRHFKLHSMWCPSFWSGFEDIWLTIWFTSSHASSPGFIAAHCSTFLPFLQVGTDELFQRQSATVSLMSSLEKEKLNEIRHAHVITCDNWQSDSSDISLHKVISHSCHVFSNGHGFPSHLHWPASLRAVLRPQNDYTWGQCGFAHMTRSLALKATYSYNAIALRVGSKMSKGNVKQFWTKPVWCS